MLTAFYLSGQASAVQEIVREAFWARISWVSRLSPEQYQQGPEGEAGASVNRTVVKRQRCKWALILRNVRQCADRGQDLNMLFKM